MIIFGKRYGIINLIKLINRLWNKLILKAKKNYYLLNSYYNYLPILFFCRIIIYKSIFIVKYKIQKTNINFSS